MMVFKGHQTPLRHPKIKESGKGRRSFVRLAERRENTFGFYTASLQSCQPILVPLNDNLIRVNV